MRHRLSRRTLLRGGTAALALPILEATTIPALAQSASKLPKRLVFLPMGYGVNGQNWFPSIEQTGTNYDLPPLLKPFEGLKSDFSILQNLSNISTGDPHAGTTNFLTCANVRQQKGVFTNSISCDQLAAERLGKDTRHSSVAIGGLSRASGHGARGYASWARDGKPVGTYRSLLDVYGALFGTGGSREEIQAMLARKKSGLDALMENARRLQPKISRSDQNRMDEYFTSIRNIETRLAKAQTWIDTPYPDAPFPEPNKVAAREQVALIFDMMVAAIQSDSTRVMSYMIPTGSILKALGSRTNPHKMSHRASGALDPEAVHQQRDLMMSELVAEFLTKLKQTKELDGSSLLDHTLVAYGSSLRQGHNNKNGPMLLAGHGGGGLKQGQNIVYEQHSTPLANLWLSMIRHVGIEEESFGNSQSVLGEVGFS